MSENGQSTGMSVATIRSAANLPAEGWSDERIKAVANFCAPKGANVAPSELAAFLAVATRYDLDPILREIWMAKDETGSIIILTGRDSFLKVARRNTLYLGYRSGIVYEKDEFVMVIDSSTQDVQLKHTIAGFSRGKLVGAYCVVYVRDRPPIVVTRLWEDYSHLQGKKNWKNYGPDMLETRVITAAHRRAFNITGLYTQEEFVAGELDESMPEEQRTGGLADLQRRMKERAGGAPEQQQKTEDIQEAEFEIISKPAEAEEQGDGLAELRSTYEAKLRELAPHLAESEFERMAFAKKATGKFREQDWDEADVRKAIAALERGEAPPPEGEEPSDDGADHVEETAAAAAEPEATSPAGSLFE